MVVLDRPTKVDLKETAWIELTIKQIEEENLWQGVYEVKEVNGAKFLWVKVAPRGVAWMVEGPDHREEKRRKIVQRKHVRTNLARTATNSEAQSQESQPRPAKFPE